ncbi:MAG: type II and III secretion system protein [Rhodothermales bacterium]|nr:type II and III secretion system protein [Rhodothermales bacterium]
MKSKIAYFSVPVTMFGLAVMLGGILVQPVAAQQTPPQRQIRTYIPPDQLVTFAPSTPFDRFIEYLSPIFLRVTGKQIVDPESRTQPIGLSLATMHFFDAFETVLQYNNLVYQESDQYFIITPAAAAGDVLAAGGVPVAGGPEAIVLPATFDTREIQIDALLFEVNHSMAKDTGIDWNVFFGDNQQGSSGSGSGSGSGGAGGSSENSARFFLKTDDLFSGVDDIISAPSRIDFSQLTQFFRLLETEGVGETVASPNVVVQSGEKGRVQIGSDIPVQVRDFAGNTVTQFFSTGIIVDVTPTLIRQFIDDGEGGEEEVEFIHMDVTVEKSGSTPSASGPTIDRSNANTQVLLLDGEQTIIGGLYTTEETVTRKGIPVLKDLPGWFFGLRYVFGRTQRNVAQKELVIVLHANVLESLGERSTKPFKRELLQRQRQIIEQTTRALNGELGAKRVKPRVYTGSSNE